MVEAEGFSGYLSEIILFAYKVDFDDDIQNMSTVPTGQFAYMDKIQRWENFVLDGDVTRIEPGQTCKDLTIKCSSELGKTNI